MKAITLIKASMSYKCGHITVRKKEDHCDITPKANDVMICDDVISAAHALKMACYVVVIDNRQVLRIYNQKD